MVIGRSADFNWPARSPNKMRLDFYFWGPIKSSVCRRSPLNNIPVLKERILQVISELNQEELNDSVSDVLYRRELVMEAGSDNFDHIKQNLN